MTNNLPDKIIFSKPAYIITAILVSGICWYLSLGLSGDYWYLLWIAPIPVFIIALHISGSKAFIVAFIAYLIGRFSLFFFLLKVAPLVPVIIFTVTVPLIFALILTITRKLVLQTTSWFSVFAFPVLFTFFEFLVMRYSPDGTAGSIAYSQSNVLPVIQLASVTGIMGITFIVTLFPAAITLAWWFRNERNIFQKLVGFSAVVMVLSLLYGFVRLERRDDETIIKVGLAVQDEKYHYFTKQPDIGKETTTTRLYIHQIDSLAAAGASIVVLPERAVNISREIEDSIIGMFTQEAKERHIIIVFGYTNFRTTVNHNSALVIDETGNVIVDYTKVHLVTGLEDQFTPGKDIGLFSQNSVRKGAAICKDLDFPDYIRKYGKASSGVLLIPAWDFVVDDWLHARMAILRGVENGFSEVRAARQGRLTTSDGYGRVTAEASASNGKAITLLGEVGINKVPTIYTILGDWFGIVISVLAIYFIGLFFRTRKQ